MLDSNQVLADLARAGHPVDPRLMKKWQADVSKVKNSDELEALMTARHRALAHTASPNKGYKGKARGRPVWRRAPGHGVDDPLVERANSFIGYSYIRPFDEQRRIRREPAEPEGRASRAWGTRR
jgi:hypothetical protein